MSYEWCFKYQVFEVWLFHGAIFLDLQSSIWVLNFLRCLRKPQFYFWVLNPKLYLQFVYMITSVSLQDSRYCTCIQLYVTFFHHCMVKWWSQRQGHMLAYASRFFREPSVWGFFLHWFTLCMAIYPCTPSLHIWEVLVTHFIQPLQQNLQD